MIAMTTDKFLTDALTYWPRGLSKPSFITRHSENEFLVNGTHLATVDYNLRTKSSWVESVGKFCPFDVVDDLIVVRYEDYIGQVEVDRPSGLERELRKFIDGENV